MYRDYALIAIKNLISRKVRSWLTIIGIVIGVGTIIALIGISQGMQNAIEDQFKKMGVQNIRVVPSGLRGPPTGEIGLDNNVVDTVKRVKSVEYVNPVLINYANIKYRGEENFLMTNGYDPELSDKGFLDVDIDLESGRFFEPGDSNVVLIGNNVAHETFDQDVHAKNSIFINDKKFRVAGIFEPTDVDLDNRIYLPLNDARELFNQKDITNALTVKIHDGLDVEKSAQQIQEKLDRKFGKDEINVVTSKQLLNQFNSIIGIVQAVLVSVAMISLLVGAIGIMNSMFTSVLERTKQIGIMKAIGARNSDVLLFFILESGFIGILGGVIGAIIGQGIAQLVGIGAALGGFPLLKIEADYFLILIVLCVSFLIGMISGIIPAIRASKLKPVDALRYE
jgi:putative ABC transport system permease protein